MTQWGLKEGSTFSDTHSRIHSVSLRGSGSPWGYVEFIRLFGYAAGYVNVDVQCRDSESCDEANWEIHDRVNVFYQGSADIGPNAYAAIAGRAVGPYGWIVANILAAGGSANCS